MTALPALAFRAPARPATPVLALLARARAAAAPPAPSPLLVLTAASAALVALAALWAAVDPRLFEGSPVWAKPLKFASSFTIMFATLALVEARLSPPWRDGRVLRATVAAMTVAYAVEMAWMILQAARAEASHFNASSPLATSMYQVMGVGAVTLVLGIAVFGAAAWRDRGADLGPALRQGVALGFGLSFVLTLITAGTLSSMGGHFIGTPVPGAATIPLLGWSATVGDLRPAHFVALHAMQALPLLGLWVDRRGGGAAMVPLAALAYAALTAALFAQALAGLPVIRL